MYKHLIKPYQYYTPIYRTECEGLRPHPTPLQYQTSQTSPIERSSSGLRPMNKEDKKKRIFGSGFVKTTSPGVARVK